MNILLTKRFRSIFTCITFFSVSLVYAQHREEAQQTIATLCSDEMAGRGYIDSGDAKAASYIASRFGDIGLKTWTPGYLQSFGMSVNKILETNVLIDGTELKAGIDYLVAPGSKSADLSGKLFYVSERMLSTTSVAKKVKRAIKKGYIPVLPTVDGKNEKASKNLVEIRKCNAQATLIYLKDKLTWSVSQTQDKYAEIWLLKDKYRPTNENIIISIASEWVKNHTSYNVAGYVEGTANPDELIIFCGHYDHLGKMGDATFYGANDNASGISMLLDMADYFVKNPQRYSIAFIAFGGEEAGLLGSLHYVKNPLLPLAKTRFVFNMDLMGSGEQGATIVNGRVYKDAYSALVKINEDNEYLPKIKSRGKAANSDHYFFSEVGVPSFFMYLMGDYMHYHHPDDNAENLELGEYYDKTFLLIRDFISALNK